MRILIHKQMLFQPNSSMLRTTFHLISWFDSSYGISLIGPCVNPCTPPDSPSHNSHVSSVAGETGTSSRCKGKSLQNKRSSLFWFGIRDGGDQQYCEQNSGTDHKSGFFGCFTDRTFVIPLSILAVMFIVLANAGMSTLTFFGPSIFEKINMGVSNKVMNVLPWFGFTLGYAGKTTRGILV